ncbi:MAG: RNA polymerase sporulation sigma factor SigE [Firmicutes bacterium]|nr:RNA polymerase sporulation sigma factor SigE [Bacillota bacterium]
MTDKIKKWFIRILAILKEKEERTVYYIGGSDLLPEPLTAQEESRMINELGGDNDKEARSCLIEKNLRLVVYIARKFENTGVNVEDLISIGTIGLIKAINTFKADKNIKLATYASRCIENEILMYLRRHTRTKSEISFDEPLNMDWEGNELLLSDILGTDVDIIYKDIEDEVDRELLRKSIEKLSKRERKIVELRYGINRNGIEKTQKEVADMLGLSQSYISRLEKKIIVRLKREFMKMI